jgi:DNA-binding CsgD family transcriptional regulator
MSDAAPLVIALHVDDPALAKRVTDALEPFAGIRLARDGEPAELTLSAAGPDIPQTALTAREREVVALLAEGLSNKEIARRLGIALDTAKFHVGRVIDKLDATGRTDAVAHAARRGVIHL